MKTRLIPLTALAMLAFAAQAGAQTDHGAHGAQGASADTFPEICRDASAAGSMGGHAQAGRADLSDHQKASMEGMMKMDRDMTQGMMKEDADVAFVCGMIAHHQGAIDMARVELQYGDDDWAKEMAQKVIDAQTREIAEMTQWLKDNAR